MSNKITPNVTSLILSHSVYANDLQYCCYIHEIWIKKYVRFQVKFCYSRLWNIFQRNNDTPPPPHTHKNKTTRNPIKSNLNRGQNSKAGYIIPQHDSIVNILDKNYEVKVIGFAWIYRDSSQILLDTMAS